MTCRSFETELNRRLSDLRVQGLHRELRCVDSPQSAHLEIDGRSLVNFSSNDYLGLANDPALKEAAIRAIQKFGIGSGASRLISGSLSPHHELEETLAEFKGTEAALSFSSGYTTALGVITALLGKEDIVIIDKLVHASIIDAARLSGAKLRVFRHNDLADLERILRWAVQRRTGISPAQSIASHTLIVTESIFSMDGNQAPLRELAELKEKYGAWLMVDEAHATGLFGSHRCGLAEALNVADRIEIQMGTLGKAIGASGGYICGSRALIDYLINRARSFIFSTAPLSAAAAAATAGIRFVESAAGTDRCTQLWQRVQEFNALLQQCQSLTPDRMRSAAPPNAIVPWMIGGERKAVEAAAAMRTRGLFVPAIRYPTVARGAAQLRITLTAAHTTHDIEQLVEALKGIDSMSRIPHSNEPLC